MNLQRAYSVARSLGPEKFAEFQNVKKVLKFAAKGQEGFQSASIKLTAKEAAKLQETLGFPITNATWAEALPRATADTAVYETLLEAKKFSPKSFIIRLFKKTSDKAGTVEHGTLSYAQNSAGSRVRSSMVSEGASSLRADVYVPASPSKQAELANKLLKNMNVTETGNRVNYVAHAPNAKVEMECSADLANVAKNILG